MLRSFLLLNPVYVSFLWTIVLLLINYKPNTARKFLSILMATSFLLYLSHYFYFQAQYHVYIYIDGLYTACSLAVYPLLHIYVRLLTVDRSFSLRKHARYLVVPSLFFILVYAGYLFLSKNEAISYVQNLLIKNSTYSGISLYLKYLYITNRLTFIIQAVIYLYLNFRLIAYNSKQLQELYSNIENRKLNWLRIFNILFAIATLVSIVLAAIGKENFMSDDRFLIFPSIVFSTLLFALGFFGFYQSLICPDDIGEIQLDKKIEIFENEPINETIIPTHFKETLLSLFEKDKIFLNKELKIWDITTKIGTNRTYVSKIINQEFNVNFCTFVNNYRVEEAKKQIKQNPCVSIEQIADLSGFGSANSLNRAFQTKENQTIAQFKRSNINSEKVY